jgi:uncharacterized protein (DUF697 family)
MFDTDYEPNPTSRAAAVRGVTEKCGYAAAALTALPIPGSELIAVMPLHIGMVMAIGQIHGVEITRDSANQLILRVGATVGLSLVGSRIATTAAKFILPGLGGLISAPFMYASTLAIGAVADTYFAREGAVSGSEMKDIYKSAVKRAKDDFDPSRAADPEVRNMAKSAVNESGAAPSAPPAAAAPAPAPAPQEDPLERLRRAKQLLEQGLIEQSEYDAAKARILATL